MGIAEALAAISAAMQAIDLYATLAPRNEIIQTLQLERNPARFQAIASSIQQSLPPGTSSDRYQRLFSKAGEKVNQCVDKLMDAMDDNLLPRDREQIGEAARACVCREIAIIKDFMAGRLPADLRERWNEHNCEGTLAARSKKELEMA
jgi:hypothetical protein